MSSQTSTSNNANNNKNNYSNSNNTNSGAIPILVRADGWAPTPRDLSTTPGGTIYATTPGGTRIVYERNALLNWRNSPYSKTPTNLPAIPGLTSPPNTQQPQTSNVPSTSPSQSTSTTTNPTSTSTSNRPAPKPAATNGKPGKDKNPDDDEMFPMEH